jgi:hypothetical protein
MVAPTALLGNASREICEHLRIAEGKLVGARLFSMKIGGSSISAAGKIAYSDHRKP